MYVFPTVCKMKIKITKRTKYATGIINEGLARANMLINKY